MRSFTLDSKEILKKKIQQTELQIKRLSINASNSDVYESLYNSLILRKAVLKKDLENLNKNKIVEKIKNILPKREKLISDYFS